MTNTNALRVLLIENDPTRSERISTLLEGANHAVLPLTCLEEATEALDIQRFDVVLLPSLAPNPDLQSFTTKLRQLEERQRLTVKAPILSFSEKVPNSSAWVQSQELHIDGYLPESFEPALFAKTVETLAVRLTHTTLEESKSSELPDFDWHAFQEQIGYDNELAVEIIDIFLGEYQDQVAEMQNALEQGNLPQLSRAAHKIKGSLGSLQAMRTRQQAEDLEQASKQEQAAACGPLFQRLVQGLEVLQPTLLQLRHTLVSGS